MKRISFAALATLAFAGVAAAQEPPVLQGNYDAAVLSSHYDNGGAVLNSRDSGIDNGAAVSGAFAISTDRAIVMDQPGGYGPQITDFEIRSGR